MHDGMCKHHMIVQPCLSLSLQPLSSLSDLSEMQVSWCTGLQAPFSASLCGPIIDIIDYVTGIGNSSRASNNVRTLRSGPSLSEF